jgi:hypothetical protein
MRVCLRHVIWSMDDGGMLLSIHHRVVFFLTLLLRGNNLLRSKYFDLYCISLYSDAKKFNSERFCSFIFDDLDLFSSKIDAESLDRGQRRLRICQVFPPSPPFRA